MTVRHLCGDYCPYRPLGRALESYRAFDKDRRLALALELAGAWLGQPMVGRLSRTGVSRKARSERRESCLIVLETLLGHLDLKTLRVGRPTWEGGFIDLDMKTIALEAGFGKRRCLRAMGNLQKAGILEVAPPRFRRDGLPYAGLRAVRSVTRNFFDALTARLNWERRGHES
ncbi:MAG: hypothetical protein LBP55_00230 [Candidatus Adiutrix sp.]|jgi:hypothetical protein|nr:hypothetical protein [Candidatus Adiutrix sp.]